MTEDPISAQPRTVSPCLRNTTGELFSSFSEPLPKYVGACLNLHSLFHSLLLLVGLPGWPLALVHHWLLMDPVTNLQPCPRPSPCRMATWGVLTRDWTKFPQKVLEMSHCPPTL